MLKRVNLALGRLKLQLSPVLPRIEELDAWSSKAGATRTKAPLGSADSTGSHCHKPLSSTPTHMPAA